KRSNGSTMASWLYSKKSIRNRWAFGSRKAPPFPSRRCPADGSSTVAKSTLESCHASRNASRVRYFWSSQARKPSRKGGSKFDKRDVQDSSYTHSPVV